MIGSMTVASFPRTTVTSMPMFLVERLLLPVAVDAVVAVARVVLSLVVRLDGVVVVGDDNGAVEVSVPGGMVVEVIPPPLSPILNVSVSGLVPSGGVGVAGVVVLGAVIVPVLSSPSPPPVNV